MRFGVFVYSGDPVSDRLTKRTIPEYGPPFFSPKYFPIHIMYYQIQKADRPAIRDTDHPFSVPNHERTRKTDQWRPGIGTPHKADHSRIRTTFFQSQIFPHSHNVLSDSESGPTRDSGHGPPFFSPKS